VRSTDKSFARLYKGGGFPKGGALWSRPQVRNTLGRAVRTSNYGNTARPSAPLPRSGQTALIRIFHQAKENEKQTAGRKARRFGLPDCQQGGPTR